MCKSCPAATPEKSTEQSFTSMEECLLPNVSTPLQLWYPGKKIADDLNNTPFAFPFNNSNSHTAPATTSTRGRKKTGARTTSTTRIVLPQPNLIFTHGKGAGLSNESITSFLSGYSTLHAVLAFEDNVDEFQRIALFRALLTRYPGYTGAFGGRSMGSRCGVKATYYTHVQQHIFFAYPLHRGMELRDGDLVNLSKGSNVLFICGDKDPLCVELLHSRVCNAMLARGVLSWLVRVKGADHQFDLGAGDDVPEQDDEEGGGKKSKKAQKELICWWAGRIAAEWMCEGGRCSNMTEADLAWDDKKQDIKWSGWKARKVNPPQKAVDVEVSIQGSRFGFSLPGMVEDS